MPRASASASAAAKKAAETSVKSQAQTINDLRNSEDTLYIQNNTSFRITIVEGIGAGKTLDMRLEPKNTDGSIKMLPKEALNLGGVQRLWISGRVNISNDPNIQDKILLLMGGHLKYAESASQDFLANTLTPAETDKALIQRTCLMTGQPVFQTQADIDAGVPPLAEHVKDKAYLFPATQELDAEGKPYWSFPKVSIG